jgi:hypothetical protein
MPTDNQQLIMALKANTKAINENTRISREVLTWSKKQIRESRAKMNSLVRNFEVLGDTAKSLNNSPTQISID